MIWWLLIGWSLLYQQIGWILIGQQLFTNWEFWLADLCYIMRFVNFWLAGFYSIMKFTDFRLTICGTLPQAVLIREQQRFQASVALIGQFQQHQTRPGSLCHPWQVLISPEEIHWGLVFLTGVFLALCSHSDETPVIALDGVSSEKESDGTRFFLGVNNYSVLMLTTWLTFTVTSNQSL